MKDGSNWCAWRCMLARIELRKRRADKYRRRMEAKAGAVHVSVRGYERSLAL